MSDKLKVTGMPERAPEVDYLNLNSVQRAIVDGIDQGIADSHNASIVAGWYTDLKTNTPLDRNLGEMLMLIVSEVAEAMEGVRKNKMDDHLPHRTSEEVELADALIRIFDYAGYRNLDLASAYIEKRRYNEQRADHKLKNRMKEDGKKF